MKSRLRSFTLVELLIVMVIIGILATLVTLGFTTAKKKSSDRKAIADVNSVASGLDQYSLSHGRIYPIPSSCAGTNCYEEITTSSGVYGALANTYVNSMPVSNGTYRFYYAVNSGGTKATVSFGPAQTSGICNDTGTLPTLASWLKGQIGANFCYYVAK